MFTPEIQVGDTVLWDGTYAAICANCECDEVTADVFGGIYSVGIVRRIGITPCAEQDGTITCPDKKRAALLGRGVEVYFPFIDDECMCFEAELFKPLAGLHPKHIWFSRHANRRRRRKRKKV